MSKGPAVGSEPEAPWSVRLVGGTGTVTGTVLADHVELADSFWGRFMGLMGRPSLPDRQGLYLAGNSIHMFFMRFPIDALFVADPDAAGNRAVIACRSSLRPWTGLVMPVKGAAAVVELPAGVLERAGVQAGMAVRFEPAGSASASGVEPDPGSGLPSERAA